MSTSEQRNAYMAAQIESIHQNLRFLEAVVREPIGLTTDLKSLRESIRLPSAEEERDRQAFLDVLRSGPPFQLGLKADQVTRSTLELVTALAEGDDAPLPLKWKERARKILDRIETRLGADLRKRAAERLRGGLYVIVSPGHTGDRPVEEIAEAALRGGAAAIQLRDKSADKGQLVQTARTIREMCVQHRALFFANDDADVAVAASAHGLHVGQTDMAAADARMVLKPEQLVGRSNATVDEAVQSEEDSADYVAVGSIYATDTKSAIRPAGLDTLRKVRDMVSVPIVAIGGINESNIGPVVEAGADCVCVLSAVGVADEPEQSARALAEIMDRAS